MEESILNYHMSLNKKLFTEGYFNKILRGEIVFLTVELVPTDGDSVKQADKSKAMESDNFMIREFRLQHKFIFKLFRN